LSGGNVVVSEIDTRQRPHILWIIANNSS
jgi:hypothetical protein